MFSPACAGSGRTLYQDKERGQGRRTATPSLQKPRDTLECVNNDVLTTIIETVTELGLPWERADHIVTVTLPGTRKLKTECALVVGDHAVEIRAFVVRQPDENHEAVYRWLMEHNLKTYAVAFSVDRHGDIYLTGRVALEAITPPEVDRILGAVAETADDSFNTLLELGFASSIRKEWEWRLSRGESTANLEAFRHLAPPLSSNPADGSKDNGA